MNKRSYMKILLTILQIGVLYGVSVIGDLLVNILKIPIPGSILGLLLVLLGLHTKVIPVTFIKEGAGFILVILPLFFIPATIGVIQYPELLSIKGMLMILMVIVSTLLTIIVVGRISKWYESKMEVER